jgi:hypothetical protein
MDTNIRYILFPYNSEVHIFELKDNDMWSTELKEMFWGGFFDGKSIYIDKFLRDDLSINLELLEVGVNFAVDYLDVVTPFDDPITLQINGLNEYYELRQISDKPKNKKEEYYVIKGIVDAVANNESIKPIKVKYVSDITDPSAWGQ